MLGCATNFVDAYFFRDGLPSLKKILPTLPNLHTISKGEHTRSRACQFHSGRHNSFQTSRKIEDYRQSFHISSRHLDAQDVLIHYFQFRFLTDDHSNVPNRMKGMAKMERLVFHFDVPLQRVHVRFLHTMSSLSFKLPMGLIDRKCVYTLTDHSTSGISMRSHNKFIIRLFNSYFLFILKLTNKKKKFSS